MAQLMREKSIREITVKELVDKVDINRSTFYLHYSDIPGMLKEIEDEISTQSKEISKIIISDRADRKQALEEIRGRLDSLNMEKAFLLTDNGFEMDFMDIRYRCPKCKDTGMLETGEKCQCFREITKEKISLMNQ